MAFPPLGNTDHVVASTSIDFPSNSKWDALFLFIAYDYSLADWDCLCDHSRDGSWDDIFKLFTPAAATEFCAWFHVGFDGKIHHCKCKVKSHICLWFLAHFPAAIVYRNHFFICTNRIDLLNLTWSLDRQVIIAKEFLKLQNFHMLIK